MGFSIRHTVSRVTGRFNSFHGTIVYDPDSPANSSVTANIEVASIDTNDERRDKDLRSANYFDAEKYPEITFVSTSVEKKGEMLMVTGDLTMHGVTKQVVLPVEVLGVRPRRAGFSAELKLRRSDFGVKDWSDMANLVGDEVSITLQIGADAAKKNPCNPCNPCNP